MSTTVRTDAPGRPMMVTLALVCISISAVLGCLAATFAALSPGFTAGLQAPAPVFLWLTFLLLMVAIQRRKDWGRRVLSLLVTVVVLIGLGVLPGAAFLGIKFGLSSLAEAVLLVVAVAMLYDPSANEWFRSRNTA